MAKNKNDAFLTAVSTCMLLFFSTCAWLMPFVAMDEEATFELISFDGDTWYVGLGLLVWFAYGAYCVTVAEANTDDAKLTALMYFKKLILVPFAPFLMNRP